MKAFFNWLLVVAVSVISVLFITMGSAHAQEVTTEQLANAIKMVQQEANKKPITAKEVIITTGEASSVLRKETAAWVDVGTGLGKAMIAMSAELGVAVNEFARTPVGSVMTAILVYKVVGSDIISTVSAFIVLLGAAVLSRRLWLIDMRIRTYEKEFVPVSLFWGLYSTTKTVMVVSSEKRGDPDAGVVFSVIVALVGLIAFVILVP